MKYTYTIIYTNIYSNTFSKAQVIWEQIYETQQHTNTHTTITQRQTHTQTGRQRKTRGAGYWTKKMENKTYIFIQINKNTFSGIIQETLFLCGYLV